jgi:hypothetical protein
MSMTWQETPGDDIFIHALKHALATLVQRVATAFCHQLSEQASHCSYSVHQLIQLGKLSFRKRSPAFRRPSDIAETKEQLADFIQCKAKLTGTLNDCQAVKHGRIVSSLAAEPFCRRKQANLLVIANR